MTAADLFRCICDPDDVFDPPDPTPVAVEGCPAHRARRAAQLFALRLDAEESAGQLAPVPLDSRRTL